MYSDGGPPDAWVGINAKLVQMPRRAIVASRSFEHRMTAIADRLPLIIDAFDEALGKVLRQLVEWALVEGESAARARQRSS